MSRSKRSKLHLVSGSKSKALYFMAQKKLMFLCCKASSTTRSIAQISLFIWGPDRLNERGRVRKNSNLGKVMNPHVIFQFSWGNKIERQKLAVDDMSLYAGQDELTPLGSKQSEKEIPISLQPDSSPVQGFDVYIVCQGQHTNIANPALTYRVGGNEDVTIEVAPVDMGLPQDAAPFLILLSDIRAEMEDLGVVFEAENQDE